MNGWMFFSPESISAWEYNKGLEAVWGAFPGMNPLSREEWHAYVPESRERRQGRTLGFFCGGGSGKNLSGMPDYPVRTFVSDFVIMPSCWTYQSLITVPASAPDNSGFVIRHARSLRVITATGTFPDKPPYFRVCGSYCFFPPPYVLRRTDKSQELFF